MSRFESVWEVWFMFAVVDGQGFGGWVAGTVGSSAWLDSAVCVCGQGC